MASETKHMNTLKAGEKGEVKIADDVVSVIAGLNKGIRLTVDDTQVHVWMKVNIRYGYNVPDTCAAVQDRVVTAIETMTGLTVAEVNVRVNSVVMDGAGTGAAE